MKSWRFKLGFVFSGRIVLIAGAMLLIWAGVAWSERTEQFNMESLAQYGGACNALALQGHFAYVGEGASLAIYDTTHPSQPSRLGSVRLPQIVNDIAVAGNLVCVTYAYADNRYAVLQVIDISNPAAPALRGKRMTAGIAPVVAMAGTRVVWGMTSTTNTPHPLEIIDLVDPGRPRFMGSLPLRYGVRDLVIAGSLIDVADGYDGLVIVDSSDPAAPVQIGSYDTQMEAMGVAVQDQMVYLATSQSGLLLIDVTHPAVPVLLGLCDTPGDASHVAVANRWAYVNDRQSRLNVIDVNTPASPTLAAQVSLRGSTCDVVTTAGLVYVAEGNSGLQLVDVHSPANPVAGGPLGPLGTVGRVAWSDSRTCVAAGPDSLQIIDLSDPQAPAPLGRFQAPATINDLICSGSLVCLAEGTRGLQVLDISQPASPTLKGELLLPASTDAAVAIADHYACLADSRGLKAIDLSDPTSPTLKGSYAPSYAWRPSGVAVSGSMICVASQHAGAPLGAIMLNITNPAHPSQFYPQTKYNGSTPDAAFAGKLACVAEMNTGLRVVDWTDPLHPLVRGLLAAVGQPAGVAVQDQHVFLTDSRLGVMAVDITNPDLPVTVGFTSTPGLAGDVAVRDDRVCVADGSGGLQVYDYRPITPTPTPFPTSQPMPDPTPRFDLLSQFGGATQLVKVEGARAYINESNNLVALDVTTPSQPRRLGRLPLDARPTALFPAGDRLYLTAGEAGLQIIDTRDLEYLTRLGAYREGGAAQGVVVANNTAFVAADTSGVLILDVRQADAPVLLGRYPTTGAAMSVDLAGGSLLCVADADNGLLVLDIGDPAHPTLKGQLTPDGYRYGFLVRVDGQTACLLTNQAIYEIDLSYPTHLTEIFSESTQCNIGGLAASRGKIYYTYTGDGLYIEEPLTRQRIHVEAGDGQGVDVAGSSVYVADGKYGLRVYDMANPAAPVEVSHPGTLGNICGLKVLGQRVFVADGVNGLKILDLNNMADPVLRGHWPSTDISFAVDVDPGQPDLAWLACRSQGLCVVDLSDPTSPTTLASHRFNAFNWAYRVRVIGDSVYCGLDTGCGIYQFSRAAGLQLFGSCAGGMEVARDGAGLAYTSNPLCVLDVTDPMFPRTVAATINNGAFAGGYEVAAGNDLACVMGSSSITIYDTRIPRITRPLTSLRPSTQPSDIAIAGNTLFVVDPGAGLLAYDVTNPAQPQFRASYGLSDNTGACLTVAGDLVYLGEGSGNLKVLRYVDPSVQSAADDHWALYR